MNRTNKCIPMLITLLLASVVSGCNTNTTQQTSQQMVPTAATTTEVTTVEEETTEEETTESIPVVEDVPFMMTASVEHDDTSVTITFNYETFTIKEIATFGDNKEMLSCEARVIPAEPGTSLEDLLSAMSGSSATLSKEAPEFKKGDGYYYVDMSLEDLNIPEEQSNYDSFLEASEQSVQLINSLMNMATDWVNAEDEKFTNVTAGKWAPSAIASKVWQEVKETLDDGTVNYSNVEVDGITLYLRTLSTEELDDIAPSTIEIYAITDTDSIPVEYNQGMRSRTGSDKVEIEYSLYVDPLTISSIEVLIDGNKTTIPATEII